MSQNTIKTSKIQIVDNEGDVAKEIYLSNGEISIDGTQIATGAGDCMACYGQRIG